jgi:putative FmdB family regulatory protein
MPIYEYQCQSCGKRTERLQSLAGPPLAACPACGGEVKKLVSAPAVQFKGSGWYVTDYAGKGKDKGGESKSESKSESNAESKSEGKAESKPESKPESKTESKSESKGESKSESKPAKASSE